MGGHPYFNLEDGRVTPSIIRGPRQPSLSSPSPSLRPSLHLSIFLSPVLPFPCSLCSVGSGLAWNGTKAYQTVLLADLYELWYQHSQP